MFQDIFLLAAAIAGIAVLWRKFLRDHAQAKKHIQTIPFLGKALTCNLCLTYWLSLAALFVTNPFYDHVYLFFAWMGLGTIAVIINFIIVLLQETIHYLRHVLEKFDHR